MHAQFKSPNSYEIAFDKYRESLFCPQPPVHDNIVFRRSHRLAIMKNDHIAQHYFINKNVTGLHSLEMPNHFNIANN